MKTKYFLASLLMAIQVQAQQQTGRVVYAFTPKMHFRAAGMQDGLEPLHPDKATVFKLEVLFGNNQMLRRTLEDNTINELGPGENGIEVHAFGMGDDGITWLNFADGRKVEQKEFATKQYLVADSIKKGNWKLTGETRNILGYACQQAITTQFGKRSMISMENGVMSRKEVPDTSYVIAWFTAAIPVPAGPDYAGQLPGLILEIDINGNTTFKAIEVSQKTDIAAIKEPKKGKKVTAEEFNNEREKAMAEMQRNGGGRRVMHIAN